MELARPRYTAHLARRTAQVKGAVCGGLSREWTMLRGTPDDVQREIADAITQTGGRRYIIGTGCVDADQHARVKPANGKSCGRVILR